jgi:hypothetical protein
VVPFDHYYFSSLTELFEVMWQQFCGLPWWDMDANRCWCVCNQNLEIANDCLSTSPIVLSAATKMIWLTKMRINNADEVILKPHCDIYRLPQNLPISMLAIFLPLYLTKGMSNFHPATTKTSFSLFY